MLNSRQKLQYKVSEMVGIHNTNIHAGGKKSFHQNDLNAKNAKNNNKTTCAARVAFIRGRVVK